MESTSQTSLASTASQQRRRALGFLQEASFDASIGMVSSKELSMVPSSPLSSTRKSSDSEYVAFPKKSDEPGDLAVLARDKLNAWLYGEQDHWKNLLEQEVKSDGSFDDDFDFSSVEHPYTTQTQTIDEDEDASFSDGGSALCYSVSSDDTPEATRLTVSSSSMTMTTDSTRSMGRIELDKVPSLRKWRMRERLTRFTNKPSRNNSSFFHYDDPQNLVWILHVYCQLDSIRFELQSYDSVASLTLHGEEVLDSVRGIQETTELQKVHKVIFEVHLHDLLDSVATVESSRIVPYLEALLNGKAPSPSRPRWGDRLRTMMSIKKKLPRPPIVRKTVSDAEPSTTPLVAMAARQKAMSVGCKSFSTLLV